MASSKPTVAIDFDGVLHAYTSGWHGVGSIPDGPVPGAVGFLLRCLADGLQPAIYSSRSKSLRGRHAMKRCIELWGGEHFRDAGMAGVKQWQSAGYDVGMDLPWIEARHAGKWLAREIAWPWFKPPSVLIIDDRAWCFNGYFPSTDTIRTFKPWNKR